MNRWRSCYILCAPLFCAFLLSSSLHAGSGFSGLFQGQDRDSSVWFGGPIKGWGELEYAPLRVVLTGGPVTNAYVRLDFDHSKSGTPGIQNLAQFTTSSNVVIRTGPRLRSSPTAEIWSYEFAIDILDANTGYLNFFARLSAGCHNFPGASMAIGGAPSLGNVQVQKPGVRPGNPDLCVQVSGPTNGYFRSVLNYTCAYTNKSPTHGASGVQVVTDLPPGATLVAAGGSNVFVGNQIIWEIGSLPPGTSGVLTWQLVYTNAQAGQFASQNRATALLAENDANASDNVSAVQTVVTSDCEPPQITNGPKGGLLCPGSPLSLTVLTSGSAPFSYRWFKDTIPLSSTNSDLIISSVSSSDSGLYAVMVSNACGVVLSEEVEVLVGTNTTRELVSTAIACPGQTAVLEARSTGTPPLSFIWRRAGQLLSDATNASLAIPSVSGIDAGTYTVEVSGACGAVTNTIRLVVRTNLTVVALEDLTVCAGEIAFFVAEIFGPDAYTVQWFKDGVLLPDETSPFLVIAAAGPADDGEYRVETQGPCNSVTNSARLVVHQPTTASPMEDVAICAGEMASLSTSAEGTGPFSYRWMKGNQLLAGQTNNTLVFSSAQPTESGTYTVEVQGRCNSVSRSATLTVEGRLSVGQLPNQTICAGETLHVQATLGGGTPTSIMWFKDGLPLPGQTNLSLTISNVTSAHSGTYSIELAGACNVVATSAVVTVLSPVAVGELGAFTVCPGDPVTFTAFATGAGPFSYTWRKDGVLLPETGAVLMFSSVNSIHEGLYTVEVRGGCGSATAIGQLNINQPVSAGMLTNQTVCVCDAAVFEATHTGTVQAFRWYHDGQLLAGENTNRLVISNLKTNHGGLYTLEIVGACNTASQSATLGVVDGGVSNPVVLSNPTPLTLVDAGRTLPFPSIINAECIPGRIKSVTVTLHGLSHDFPDDLDIFLSAPNGLTSMLMSDAGGYTPLSGVDLKFDMAAPGTIPDDDPIELLRYQPGDYDADDYSPVWPGNLTWTTNLHGFNGLGPNGIWGLHIIDDSTLDVGQLNSGWSIEIGWEVLRPQLAGPRQRTDGLFQFTLLGDIGKTYLIEASSDLRNWAGITTTTLSASQQIVVDLKSFEHPYRFYRAIQCP